MSIEVFGSAILRVEPDIAQLSFSVSQTSRQPKDAFNQSREATQELQKFMAKAGIKDIQLSRLQLQQEYRQKQYTASTHFSVLVHDLDTLEDILVGLVNAGANQIGSTTFQTSRLKEFRAEARKRAVAAAIEKAQLYCEATGANLGKILNIEDVNPDTLRGFEGHTQREMPNDDEEPTKLFSPNNIAVRGAIRLTYALS
jgi:uncharacterized protein